MSEAVEKTKNIAQVIKENSLRYIATFASTMEYLALQLAPTSYQPDAIIAGLPVYHIQHEGHAASDEMLKYRSMGTIFLAHQKGGKRTFKCTLLIEGPARLYILMFLQFVQKNGIQSNIPLSQFASNVGIELPAPVSDPFISTRANDKVRYMQDYEIESEMLAWHKTFPIITDTKIYSNMYLETLRYVEDVKLGSDTMQIDLAFREFIPPLHVKWYKGNVDKKEKGYFTTWLNDTDRDALRRMDLMMNGLWALRNYIEEVYHPNVQRKQRNMYNIEGAVLLMGALLGKATIWRK